MRKSITLTFISLFALFSLKAQDEIRDDLIYSKHSIYFEVLGTGSLYSINYDRLLLKKDIFGIAGRIGFTYSPVIEGFSDIGGPGIPIELSTLFGKGKNKIELGLGLTYHHLFDTPKNFHAFFLTPRFGYRFQKAEGGFSFAQHLHHGYLS